MTLSLIRIAMRAERRTASRFALSAMIVAGIAMVIVPSGPLKVVALFVTGAVYGWSITHMLNTHQRRMDMQLVREAVAMIPPECRGMCRHRVEWSSEQRTEHSEFHA